MVTRRNFAVLSGIAISFAVHSVGRSEKPKADIARNGGAPILENENCSFLHGAREDFAASFAGNSSKPQRGRSVVCPLCQQKFWFSSKRGTIVVSQA
jgi:hypothetical protein